jgi:hypothetical protein
MHNLFCTLRHPSNQSTMIKGRIDSSHNLMCAPRYPSDQSTLSKSRGDPSHANIDTLRMLKSALNGDTVFTRENTQSATFERMIYHFQNLPPDSKKMIIHFVGDFIFVYPKAGEAGRQLTDGPRFVPIAYEPGLDAIFYTAPDRESVLSETITGKRIQFEEYSICAKRVEGAPTELQIQRIDPAGGKVHIYPVVKLACYPTNDSINMAVGLTGLVREDMHLTLAISGRDADPPNQVGFMAFWTFDFNELLNTTDYSKPIVPKAAARSAFQFNAASQPLTIYKGAVCYQSSFTTRIREPSSGFARIKQRKREMIKKGKPVPTSNVRLAQTQLMYLDLAARPHAWNFHPDMLARWNDINDYDNSSIMFTSGGDIPFSVLYGLNFDEHHSCITTVIGSMVIPDPLEETSSPSSVLEAPKAPSTPREELWCISYDANHILLFSYITRIQIFIPMDLQGQSTGPVDMSAAMPVAVIKHAAIYLFLPDHNVEVYRYDKTDLTTMIKSTYKISASITVDTATIASSRTFCRPDPQKKK